MHHRLRDRGYAGDNIFNIPAIWHHVRQLPKTLYFDGAGQFIDIVSVRIRDIALR